MSRVPWLAVLGLMIWGAMAAAAHAQERPYIGFVYPAGGRQGTTFQIKVCGNNLHDVDGAIVTGTGVAVKVVEYFRKLELQDILLLREQIQELAKRAKGTPLAWQIASLLTSDLATALMWPSDDSKVAPAADPAAISSLTEADRAALELVGRIKRRLSEHVEMPAYAAFTRFVRMEVTIAADAPPGAREIRLVTWKGVSNPLVFHVGQFAEFTRKPMVTDKLQVLGKEHLSQRRRLADEIEQRITVPSTVNGQIASGEVNVHRFQARKGQRVVIATAARQLIPYIADAVPGWFQPVLTLYDANGKELAYNDDYRFHPDPVIFFDVPKDGEYVFTITDALYRGREDFVYRVTIGEVPFVTSIFPLGGREGALPKIRMQGWNLKSAELLPPTSDARPGIHSITARDEAGIVSNRVPFAVDTLPEAFDEEPNNDPAHAQQVTLPVIVNGRIDRENDSDVFQFTGRAGDTVVAEVQARRLDSPLDSLLKVIDAQGRLLAQNDDCEDLGAGLNTHHADSCILLRLPADGVYRVQLRDTACHGGAEYAYRLRMSAPRPDFALRVVPSSVSMGSKGIAAATVLVLRRDGFGGPIRIGLKDPPAGFSSYPLVSSPPRQPGDLEVARLVLKTELRTTPQPLALGVEGRAMVDGRLVAHDAVPAEDRMQAFLWRHLVPAEDFRLLVFDPSRVPAPKRVPPPIPLELLAKAKAAVSPSARFGKEEIRYRRWVLGHLFEENLITGDLYVVKAAECEAAPTREDR